MNEANEQACPHSKTMLCGEHYEWCPECGAIRRVGKFLAPLMSWQHPSYERLAGDQQPEPAPKAGGMAGSVSANGYVHPTSIQSFEAVYRAEYAQEIEACDSWIKWCEGQNDTHGINFHQGLRSALIFNDIKMHQLLRVLKHEAPSARRGHNDPSSVTQKNQNV